MFKHICLLTAALFGVVIVYIVNDVRVDVKSKLAEIRDKTQTVADESKQAAESLRELRELLSGPNKSAKHGFMAYANEVLSMIEAQKDAKIGVGDKMRDALDAPVWTVNARKEAVLLAMWENTKEKMLHRLCRTAMLRSEFYMQQGGAQPRLLEAWIRENHAESGSLPESAR